MTVTYSSEVATATLGAFGSLLFRWKASVYKLVWCEMLIFIVLYATIALVYHLLLNCEQIERFNGVARYCKTGSEAIPLTFVLGFYVSLVISRWWAIIDAVAWPDRACYCVSMCIPSQDPQMVQYRRAIARYINLAQLVVLRECSTAVKTRFPTLDKVVSDGFMTLEERQIYDSVKGENQLEKHLKYWLIIQWATNVLCRAYDQKSVRDKFAFTKAFREIIAFRDKLGTLINYDWIPIPLSYTQVVTLVVYAYFLAASIGRQTLREYKCFPTTNLNCTEIPLGPDKIVQVYVPIFPLLEFVFYMGWLKVAEVIMNPLGRDDDDMEINYVIDRNLAVSYGIVDSYKDTCPEVKKEIEPVPGITNIKAKTFKGSANMFSPTDNPDGTRKAIGPGRRLRQLLKGQEGGVDETADPNQIKSPKSAQKSLYRPDSTESPKGAVESKRGHSSSVVASSNRRTFRGGSLLSRKKP